MYLCKEVTDATFTGEPFRLPGEFRTAPSISVQFAFSGACTGILEGRNNPDDTWVQIGANQTTARVISAVAAREMRVRLTGNAGTTSVILWD